MNATEKERFRNEFFDEILIVLVSVIFDKSSTSGSLLLFFEELLDGISHWPYSEDNLYWLTVCFGARPISHEIVTESVMFKMLHCISETYIGQNLGTEKQSIQPVENWILNWLSLCNHWLLSTLKVVSTLVKTTVGRMSKIIMGLIPQEAILRTTKWQIPWNGWTP